MLLKLNSASDGFLFSTVRITATTAKGEVGFGTGMLYMLPNQDDPRERMMLLTNRHVVAECNQLQIKMTVSGSKLNLQPDGSISIKMKVVTLPNAQSKIMYHNNPTVDLAVIDLSWLQKKVYEAGDKFIRPAFGFNDFVSPDCSELHSTEEVLMFGFPNALEDSESSFPLIRSGITATNPQTDFKGRPIGAVDIGAFPGSSGSPIFTTRRVMRQQNGQQRWHFEPDKLLGVLYAGPQFSAEGKVEIVPIPLILEAKAVTRIPMHLGYYIKAREVKGLLDQALATFPVFDLPHPNL